MKSSHAHAAKRAAGTLTAAFALVLALAAPAGAGWLEHRFEAAGARGDQRIFLPGGIGSTSPSLVSLGADGYVRLFERSSFSSPTFDLLIGAPEIIGGNAYGTEAHFDPTGSGTLGGSGAMRTIIGMGTDGCTQYFPRTAGSYPVGACVGDRPSYAASGPIAAGDLVDSGTAEMGGAGNPADSRNRKWRSPGDELVRAPVCNSPGCEWSALDHWGDAAHRDYKRHISGTGLVMQGGKPWDDHACATNEASDKCAVFPDHWKQDDPLQVWDHGWIDQPGADKTLCAGGTQAISVADVDDDGDKDVVHFGARCGASVTDDAYGFEVWLNKPELETPRVGTDGDGDNWRNYGGVGRFHKMPFVATDDMGPLVDGMAVDLNDAFDPGHRGAEIVALSRDGFEIFKFSPAGVDATGTARPASMTSIGKVEQSSSPGAGGGDQLMHTGMTTHADVVVVSPSAKKISIFENTTPPNSPNVISFHEGFSGEPTAKVAPMPRTTAVTRTNQFPGRAIVQPGDTTAAYELNNDSRVDFVYWDNSTAEAGGRFHTMLQTGAPRAWAKPAGPGGFPHIADQDYVYTVVGDTDIAFDTQIEGLDIDKLGLTYRWKFGSEAYGQERKVYAPPDPTIVQIPAKPAPGQSSTFSADTKDAGGRAPYTYRWWVDGFVQEGQTGPRLTRTLSDGERRTVKVEVTDALGARGEDSHEARTSSLTARFRVNQVNSEEAILNAFVTRGGALGREERPPNFQTGEPATTASCCEYQKYQWFVNGEELRARFGPEPRGPERSNEVVVPMTGTPVVVKLVVTDRLDNVSEYSQTIDPQDPSLSALQARIMMTPEPVIGSFARFESAMSSGPIQHVEWYFDNVPADPPAEGEEPPEPTPPAEGEEPPAPPEPPQPVSDDQLYQKFDLTPGRHTVALVVYSSNGQQSMAKKTFWVGQPLVTTLGAAPLVPDVGEDVTLTAAPSGGEGPYSFKFDLDGDGTYEADSPTAAVEHTFTTAGSRTVGVEVTDAAGMKATALQDVRVGSYRLDFKKRFALPAGGGASGIQLATVEFTNAGGDVVEDEFYFQVVPPLSASFSTDPSPAKPVLGEYVTFTASASGGNPPESGYTYEWLVDGQVVAGQTAATFRHKFDQPGRHTIALKVSDGGGSVATVPEKSIRWADPLIADLDAGREPGTTITPMVGEQVRVSAAGTTGGIGPFVYEFDLDGDAGTGPGGFELHNGTSPQTTIGPFGSTAPRTVRVRVSDSDDADRQIDAQDLTITILPLLTTALRHAGNGRAVPGEPTSVDAATDTSGGEGPYTYAWTIDGAPNGHTGGVLTHTFAMPAAWHDVAMTVRDVQGRTKTADPVAIRAAAPVVPVIKATPPRPDAREDVVLSAAETTGGLRPLHYEWDLDGNGSYEISSSPDAVLPAKKFRAAGEHPIKVRIHEDQPAGRPTEPDTDSATFTLHVYDPLAPSIGQSPAQARPGHAVTFDALSIDPGGQGPAYSFKWFVDNQLRVGKTASTLAETFAAPGRHSVRVEITDARGYSQSDEIEFKVADELVAAFTTDNQSPQAGETVRFDASGTSGGLPPYATFDWDLDGDGDVDEAAGHGPAASWTYDTAETVSATLTVTDDDNVSDDTERVVRIGGELQADALVTPAHPGVGDTVTFDGQPTGGGTLPYRYEWLLDGSETPETGGTGATLERSFDDPGRHSVVLRVTDARDRVSTTDPMSFKVADPLEVTGLTATPATPDRGEPTEFAAAVTGGLPPLSYRFDLDGDAATGPDGFEADAAALPEATRSFPAAGTRTVRVKATDDDGEIATRRLDIRVVNPVATTATVSPAKPRPGGEVVLSAAGASGGVEPYTYAWTFDDDFEATTAEVRRTYEHAGRHKATVVVTDGRGRSATAEREFRVGDPLAVTLSAAPNRPQTDEDVAFTATPVGGIGPFEYAFDLDGDGTYSDYDSPKTATTSYAQTGDRRPAARVRDVVGDIATVSIPVTISPPLVARATFQPEQPAPKQTTTFDASGSSGGTPPRTYRWDADGDGTYESDTGRVAVLKTSFPTRGDHVVKTEVTDAAGHVAVTETALFVGARPKATISASTATPEVGDEVTVVASATPEGAYTYRFDTDGTPGWDTEESETATTTIKPQAAGRLTVSVQVTDDRNQTGTAELSLEVAAPLVAHVSAPANVQPDEEVTVDAGKSTGGTPPLRYRWDLDADGTFERDSGTVPSIGAKFTKEGQHTVAVQVRDVRKRERTASTTLTSKTPSETDVETCVKTVQSGLAQFKGPKCWLKTGTRREPAYKTSEDVTLNGLPFYMPGNASITVTLPNTKLPGGKMTITSGEVKVMGVKIFDGSIDWKLPDPGDDDDEATEGQIAGGGFNVRSPVKMFDLQVEGAIRLVLGRDGGEGSQHYTRLRADAALPSFKLMPYRDSPGATARLSLRYDDNGLKAEALYFQIEHAYLAQTSPIKVQDVCLSYTAAGYNDDEEYVPEKEYEGVSLTKPDDGVAGVNKNIELCETFADASGQEFLTCRVDNSVDNWKGTLEFEMPMLEGVGLAASVGVGGGKISNIAMKAGLGDLAPIKKELIYVRSIAAGVCLNPAPLQVRGEVLVGALPIPENPIFDGDLIEVAGGFYYKEAYKEDPWRFELNGTLNMIDTTVGKAKVGFNGNGTVYMDAKMRLAVPPRGFSLVSIEGAWSGFFGTRGRLAGKFNAEGGMETCVVELFCQGSHVLFSSKGMAACVTLLSLPSPLPDLEAGFGVDWGAAPTIMALSCDVGPWRVSANSSRVLARASAAGGLPFDVAKDERVKILRVRGAERAPKLRLTGPDGTVIASAPSALGAEVKGKWRLIEDPTAKGTIVAITDPAPGRWTIEAINGDKLLGLDTAQPIMPMSIEADVKPAGGTDQVLEYAYTPQDGTELTFYETDPKDPMTQRGIGTAKPGPCATSKIDKLDRKLSCGTIRFTPTYGAGGTRKIVADVSRDGRPVDKRDVATYTAPAPVKVGQVRGLRVVRGKKGLIVVHKGHPGAASYEIAAAVDDGYGELKEKVRPGNSRFPSVPRGKGVTVTVVGIDALQRRGPRRVIRLKPGVMRAPALKMKATKKKRTSK